MKNIYLVYELYRNDIDWWNRMDMKQLLYFSAIAEEGSISAAAKKLHISQPPLSHQLKLLESELGVKLAERGPRHIRLTDAGAILYRRASAILELSDATLRELSDFGRQPGGTLRLGITSSSGPALLKKRLTDYSSSFPGVRFEIHEGNTFQLIDLLASGEIDIAIVRTPFHAENTDSFALQSEPMIAAEAGGFLAGIPGSEIRMTDLQDKPLIYYRRFEKMIFAACQANGFRPNVFCLNDDARTSLMWAGAGLGVAIVPRSMQPYAKDCVCRPIREKALQSSITAVWRNDRYLSASAKIFLEFFRKPEET